MEAMPSYRNPPVSEVAIGVQFNPMRKLSAAHVGLYWALIRDNFPEQQEHAPIQHVVEPENVDVVGTTQVSWQVADIPDIPRSWFLTHKGTELIQVQRDRYLYNWRKAKLDDPYPRYPQVKSHFFKHWDKYQEFLSNHGLPRPTIDQCELTYVNPLLCGREWNEPGDLSHILLPCQWKTRNGFLPRPEALSWSTKFALPDGQGRLHVSLHVPSARHFDTKTARFALTARGVPTDLASDGIGAWFDLAREWIVKGFNSLTTERANEIWRVDNASTM